jgi:sugar lactone lactonase YvrE
VLLSLSLVACGQDDGPIAGDAAEPGEAPASATAVPGRVLPLDGRPEGIVVTSTGVAAVALRKPDRLALVDLASGRTSEVPLASAARHLTLAAPTGPVVAPLERADEVVLVDPSTGEVVEQFPGLSNGPHDAAVHPSGLISVTDEHGSGLYVLDPAGGDVQRVDSSRQPGGVAPVGDLAVSVDVTGQGVRVFDVVELRQVAQEQLGTRLTHVVALDGKRVAIADTDGDRLIVASVTPQVEDVVELEVEGEPYGLAFDEARSRLYVTLTDRNEMLVYDTDRLDAGPLGAVPTVGQANTVAVQSGGDLVVVAGRAQGALQLLRPADLPAG